MPWPPEAASERCGTGEWEWDWGGREREGRERREIRETVGESVCFPAMGGQAALPSSKEGVPLGGEPLDEPHRSAPGPLGRTLFGG